MPRDGLRDGKVEMTPFLMPEEFGEPERVQITPFLTPEEAVEPKKVEMIPFLMPADLGDSEKEGEDTESESGGSLETEPEPAGDPAAEPETKEEGPVVLNKPGPVDPPELFPDFAGNMLPLEQFRLPMGQERLIPAGMEDTYVTTLTHRG